MIFLAMITLTLLATYLYVFKKPWATLVIRQTALRELKDEQQNSTPLGSDIEQTEKQIALLEHELNGGSKLPAKQLVAHIINQLDQIAKNHGVKLSGITPGNKKSILMFDEIPFHIEINGDYHNLYDWLQEVGSRLGPMVVKEFEIQPNKTEKHSLEMRLTIASYRQNS